MFSTSPFRDLVGSAKTGSGKTLAFLVPCIELIAKLRPSARNGTIAVVLSPTRELALQTYCVLRELMNPPVDEAPDTLAQPSVRAHPFTYGLVMGGTSRFDEAKKLAKGAWRCALDTLLFNSNSLESFKSGALLVASAHVCK